MSEQQHLVVHPSGDNERVDAWIAAECDVSRASAARWVREGHVRLNGRALTKPSQRVHATDTVVVSVPAPTPLDVPAQAIPLTIAYEDAHVVVINKPAGMVVHPAPGHPDGTLVNAVLHHCRGQLSGIGGVERPGIVHRIDRDTSGLIVIAKDDATHQHLQARFAAHEVERRYVAIAVRTHGPGLEDHVRFETSHGRHPTDRKRFTGRPGGSRHAVTNVDVVERFGSGAMLVACRLETGRTHQIRMHLSEAGCPILGDPLYGYENPRLIRRTALHAMTLGFDLPDGTTVSLEAPPPDDFERALAALRGGNKWHR